MRLRKPGHCAAELVLFAWSFVILLQKSQVDVSRLWCEDGSTLTPGSYVTNSDATGKYLKAHVPGTRELTKHAVKFASRTLKNNGINSITKKALKDLCTSSMQQGMHPYVNVEQEDEKQRSCSWGCFSKATLGLKMVGKFFRFWWGWKFPDWLSHRPEPIILTILQGNSLFVTTVWRKSCTKIRSRFSLDINYLEWVVRVDTSLGSQHKSQPRVTTMLNTFKCQVLLGCLKK